jgi:hypothetical protein
MPRTADQARAARACGRPLMTYSRRHIDLQRVAAALCPAARRIAP